MTMRRAPTLLAALTLCACAPAGPPTERVAIPALHCTLEVPVGTAVTLTDDGASLTTRPGARAPRTFTIHARPPGEPGQLQRTLAADVSITYSLRADPGGSGGEESLLSGALKLGDRTFAVECHDQGERPDTPNATWCLPWLATLQPDR